MSTAHSVVELAFLANESSSDRGGDGTVGSAAPSAGEERVSMASPKPSGTSRATRARHSAARRRIAHPVVVARSVGDWIGGATLADRPERARRNGRKAESRDAAGAAWVLAQTIRVALIGVRSPCEPPTMMAVTTGLAREWHSSAFLCARPANRIKERPTKESQKAQQERRDGFGRGASERWGGAMWRIRAASGGGLAV